MLFAVFTIGCQNKQVQKINDEALPKDNSSNTASSSTQSETLKTFTLDELSKFDGKDGNPAYVSIDGKVYDVTNVPAWKNGMHAGKLTAGKDYTDEIQNAPHKTSPLKDLTVIGTLEK